MIRHWPIVLFLLTTVGFYLWGPELEPVYRAAQSIGWSVVTFVLVFAVLVLIQALTGHDLHLYSSEN